MNATNGQTVLPCYCLSPIAAQQKHEFQLCSIKLDRLVEYVELELWWSMAACSFERCTAQFGVLHADRVIESETAHGTASEYNNFSSRLLTCRVIVIGAVVVFTPLGLSGDVARIPSENVTRSCSPITTYRTRGCTAPWTGYFLGKGAVSPRLQNESSLLGSKTTGCSSQRTCSSATGPTAHWRHSHA